ncbi:MAG: reverse transcriptase domain-containing protein [Eubacterium sp.]|nr:reverse transcriptase domain-containing protein [Eubacterium sp.]
MGSEISLDSIFTESNIKRALKHVAGRKRMPGADHIPVQCVAEIWEKEGEEILDAIYRGTYVTKPFLEVRIRKKSRNAYRKLQLPAAIDRVIAETMNKELSDFFDPSFSSNSYGFRKSRGAHDALRSCLNYMNYGYKYVVDLDIQTFFDCVNHEKLKYFLQLSIDDLELLTLISRFFSPKLILGRHVYQKYKGLPQGCSLSPLLANVYLNKVDCYLEMNHYDFVRYADDLVVFATTESRARRIMLQLKHFLQKEMQLEINMNKSKVCLVDDLEYLGYSFRKWQGGYVYTLPEAVQWDTLSHMKKLFEIKDAELEKMWDDIGSFNRGWVNYYSLVEQDEMSRFLQLAQMLQERCLLNKLKNLSEEAKRKACDGLYNARSYSTLSGWYKKLKGGI